MAGFDYAKAARTAERLIGRFGRPQGVTLKRMVPGSGPDWNPGPPSWITYTCTAVILQASKGTIEAFDNRLERGSLIDEKLRYVVMSPQMVRTSATGPDHIEPKSTDILEFDGSTWTVLGCTPLNPAGTPVYYPMGVRRLGATEAPPSPEPEES